MPHHDLSHEFHHHDLSHEFRIDTTKESWTEEWWQWAVQLPTGNNPFEDLEGALAKDGNVRHNLFFLAGLAGSSESQAPNTAGVRREFDVPSNVKLVVPILNTAESVPDWEFFFPGQGSEARVAQYIHDWKTSYVVNVFFEIDGHKINLDDKFVETSSFSLGSVKKGEIGYDLFNLRPENADQSPALAGGYWATVKNLSLGEHKLHFGGALDFNDAKGNFGKPDGVIDFNIDITDIINVVRPGDYHKTVESSCADLVLA